MFSGLTELAQVMKGEEVPRCDTVKHGRVEMCSFIAEDGN